MKVINIIILILGSYFAIAGLFFIYSAITKSEEILQKIYGGVLLSFTRVGVLVGLLFISIYFYLTKSIFKYNIYLGAFCLFIWLIVIISAFFYLNNIY